MYLKSLELEKDFDGSYSPQVDVSGGILNLLNTEYIAVECAAYVGDHAGVVSISMDAGFDGSAYQSSASEQVLAVASALAFNPTVTLFRRDTFPNNFSILRKQGGVPYAGASFHLVLRFTEYLGGEGHTLRCYNINEYVNVVPGDPIASISYLSLNPSRSIGAAEYISYNQMTMTCWVKMNSVTMDGETRNIFVLGTDDWQKQRRISVVNDTFALFAYRSIYATTQSNTAQVGVWRHVAITANGASSSDLQIFLDGQLQGTGYGEAFATWGATNTKIMLGFNPLADCSVRQCMVFEQVLTAAEIEDIYNSGFEGNGTVGTLYAAPTRLYLFEGDFAGDIEDESGNGGNNLALGGTYGSEFL